MKENKILRKFFDIFNIETNKDISFKNLPSINHQFDEILNQFIIVYENKKIVKKILYFFDKKYNHDEYLINQKHYENYLKESNKMYDMIKKYNKQKYGIIISQTIKLLEKVK